MNGPTKEQVIEWAQDAGFTVRNGVVKAVHGNGSWVAVNDRLAEFAAISFAAGQAAEREAYQDGWTAGVSAYREAIRTRGKNENIS